MPALFTSTSTERPLASMAFAARCTRPENRARRAPGRSGRGALRARPRAAPSRVRRCARSRARATPGARTPRPLEARSRSTRRWHHHAGAALFGQPRRSSNSHRTHSKTEARRLRRCSALVEGSRAGPVRAGEVVIRNPRRQVVQRVVAAVERQQQGREGRPAIDHRRRGELGSEPVRREVYAHAGVRCHSTQLVHDQAQLISACTSAAARAACASDATRSTTHQLHTQQKASCARQVHRATARAGRRCS